MAARAPRAATGRPTALSPENRKRILDAVEMGAPYRLAAAAAGIHPGTMSNWIARGERAQDALDLGNDISDVEEWFRTFREEVEYARGRGGLRVLLNIQRVAQGGELKKRTTKQVRGPEGWETHVEEEFTTPDWRAGAWVADRTFRDLVGKDPATEVEVSGPDGGPVQVTATALSETAERIARLVAERRLELEDGSDIVDGEIVDQ